MLFEGRNPSLIPKYCQVYLLFMVLILYIYIYIYIYIKSSIIFIYFLYIFLELKFKITFIHVIIMRSQVSGVLSPQTFAIIIYNYERAFSVARTQTPVIK